jgi:hypothetical protein
MTLKKYIENLQKFAKDNPDALDTQAVISYYDDYGLLTEEIDCEPELVFYGGVYASEKNLKGVRVN